MAKSQFSNIAPAPALSESDLTYRRNMIKGRIAEALIEELFLSIGCRVYRFGMENTVPEVRGQLAGHAKVTTLIRSMPDFVVHPPHGEPILVEVKFRANGLLDIARDQKFQNYPYEDALFILVSKRHIKAKWYRDLRQAPIEPSDANYLGSIAEFRDFREPIKQFCDFAVKFFESVPEGHAY